MSLDTITRHFRHQLFALFGVLLLTILPVVTPAQAACGEERWDIKTGTDPGAADISLDPRATTVHQLVHRTRPVHIHDNHLRQTTTEKKVWQVDCEVIGYVSEDDSDIHVAIWDLHTHETMIVEFPDPDCVQDSVWLDQIRQSRADFQSVITNVPGEFKQDQRRAKITGVGFFDFRHHQRGLAKNAIELHPVLSIEWE